MNGVCFFKMNKLYKLGLVVLMSASVALGCGSREDGMLKKRAEQEEKVIVEQGEESLVDKVRQDFEESGKTPEIKVESYQGEKYEIKVKDSTNYGFFLSSKVLFW